MERLRANGSNDARDGNGIEVITVGEGAITDADNSLRDNVISIKRLEECTVADGYNRIAVQLARYHQREADAASECSVADAQNSFRYRIGALPRAGVGN